MTDHPINPRLQSWIRYLERTGWAAFVLDESYRLVWVSDELKDFLDASEPDELGLGKHMIESYFLPAWSRRLAAESQTELFNQVVPYLLGDEDLKRATLEHVPPELAGILKDVEPKPLPDIWAGSFMWKKEDMPEYRVDIAASLMRDESGRPLGAWFVTFMGVRPKLLVLLALGDQAMYERMENLVEPRRRRAAVMFADLESSGALSRQLPTAMYFRLIRQLSTVIDEVVGQHIGITGKHAGDGSSAFFLVDDLGSESKAAAAAVAAARELQARVDELDVPVAADAGQLILNVGLHWGAGLYMGQLVPGGRLDVTAIGDEVNECARIQETARAGSLLASKVLLEQLEDGDAAALGIELEKLVYRPLSEMPGVGEKAARDAGAVAVAEL